MAGTAPSKIGWEGDLITPSSHHSVPCPSWNRPQHGSSSQTQAAFSEPCIWLLPKSYNHFILKTTPAPAPYLHSACTRNPTISRLLEIQESCLHGWQWWGSNKLGTHEPAQNGPCSLWELPLPDPLSWTGTRLRLYTCEDPSTGLMPTQGA